MVKRVTCLLYLTLCFYSGVLFSQSYHTMLRSGRLWDELHFAPEICWADYGRRFVIGADSVTAGETWKKLMWYDVTSGTSVFCAPFYADVSGLHTDDILLREDSVARRVYILIPGDTAKLLYDFSLSVGDPFVSGYTTQGDTFTVSAVNDVTLMNGDVVNEFSFTPEGSYTESIGSYQGMYGPLFLLEYPMQIQCVSQDAVQLTGSECYSILSVTKGQEAESLDVFPNPAADLMMITIPPGGNGLLEMYDPAGRMVHEQTCTGTLCGIDVSHLPAGLYYLHLRGSEGTWSGRCVIAR